MTLRAKVGQLARRESNSGALRQSSRRASCSRSGRPSEGIPMNRVIVAAWNAATRMRTGSVCSNTVGPTATRALAQAAAQLRR